MFLLVIVSAGVVFPATAAEENDGRSTTVGMPARIPQIVIPGPELEVKPIENADAVVVARIVSVFPHGTAYRYDLEYYALEPGRFNLSDSLQRAGGSPAENLPAIEVEVRPLLPPGQVLPHGLEPATPPTLGGYRRWIAAGIAAWVAGLLAILLLRRGGKEAARQEEERAVTVADRLRPLVEDAIAGRLDEARRAELERTLLGYWRKRLDLQAANPDEAMATLRDHPDAGPLLNQLENWLHRPASHPREEIDVGEMLKPYRNLPAEPAS